MGLVATRTAIPNAAFWTLVVALSSGTDFTKKRIFLLVSGTLHFLFLSLFLYLSHFIFTVKVNCKVFE